MLKRHIFLLEFGATSSWQRVRCPFSSCLAFNISAVSSEYELLRIQPWPTSKTNSSVGSSLLLQAAHVQAEIIKPWATWSRHMEQHSLEESTWSNEYLGLFRRERRRRRSACSEFGIESFLSHRKLPIQAVTYSGGRRSTGAGFYPR